jgi:hypothetical protein
MSSLNKPHGLNKVAGAEIAIAGIHLISPSRYYFQLRHTNPAMLKLVKSLSSECRFFGYEIVPLREMKERDLPPSALCWRIRTSTVSSMLV